MLVCKSLRKFYITRQQMIYNIDAIYTKPHTHELNAMYANIIMTGKSLRTIVSSFSCKRTAASK